MRKQFESGPPNDTLKIIHRATDNLPHLGIMERVLKKGDHATEYTLLDEIGDIVSSSELLNKGPLAINFYRGVW